MGQTEAIEAEDGVGHPRVGAGAQKSVPRCRSGLKSLESKEMEDIGIST